MERLISDANKLKEANGEAGDLTIQKFSDVVEAIHLVQDELGIVNATRDEALTTIEGSAGAAQAAWENLLTGIADPAADLGQLLDDFVNSKMVEMDNLIPTIEHSIEGIGDAIEKLLPKVSAGSEVFEKLTDELGTKAPELLIGLGESLIKALPLLADAALSIAEKLITSVADQMPELIPDLIRVIGDLISTIISHADEIVDAGIKLVLGLAKGLGEAIPQLLDSAGQLIGQLVFELGQLLTDALPRLMNIGVDAGQAVAQGLMEFDWTEAAEHAIDSLSESFYQQLKNNEDLANLFGYETADALDAKLAEAEARLAESKAVREEAKREAAEAETAAKAIDKKTQGIRDAAEAQAAAYKAASESERGKALAEVTGKIDLARMENAWDRIYHWDKENYEEYWEEQRKWLEEHKENTEEWWNAWNKNEEHYRKKAEDDEKARADEEKKRKDKLEKDRKAQADAEKERIKQQKEAIDDAFKELEIQKKNEGKDQGWLLEQERAYIDALDKSSELYKEYDQKWRSSWADWEETRRKEEEKAYKKAQDTRIKEMEALIKEGKAAAEKLAAEYAKGQQSIMDAANNPTRVTDIKGEDRLVFTDFSKKIQQLKKYQQNLDKLSGIGLSEQHLRDIFSMDLDTRMKYIEELLRMSESGRQAYLNDYEKYYAMAGQTARTETQLSGRESELMEESINTALDDIADNSYVMGKQAKEEWLKGWNEGGGGALSEPYIEQLYGKGSAAAQTSPDISGNVTINIAGQNVIQTTMADFFRAIKNSGGTLDI